MVIQLLKFPYEIILKNSVVVINTIPSEIPVDFSSKFLNLHLKRIKEKYSTYSLLKYLDINPLLLMAEPSGKPYLNTLNKTISISHSNLYGCVQLGKNEFTGIDIQYHSEKIEKISHKYLNYKELSFSSYLDNVEKLKWLHLFWSIKEAVFKYFGKGVDFKNDINIDVDTITEDDAKVFVKDKILLLRLYIVNGQYCAVIDM